MSVLRRTSIVPSQMPNGAQPSRRGRRELELTRVWSRGLAFVITYPRIPNPKPMALIPPPRIKILEVLHDQER
jgi:hypothetical protein